MVIEIEINHRITALQEEIDARGLGGVLLIDRVNIFYFSGSGRQCRLYVPSFGEPVLMVKDSVEKAKGESPLKNIVAMRGSKDIPDLLKGFGIQPAKKVGMELDVLPARSYLYYNDIFEYSEILDCSSIIRNLRMTKSEHEISQIRTSGLKHAQFFENVKNTIKLGITDMEIAGSIEGYARSIGHLGYTPFRGFNVEFYMGHTLVGSAGAASGPYDLMVAGGEGVHPTFPQGVSGAKVREGDPIYVDYVGNYNGYCVDQTRVFCVGKVPELVKRGVSIAIEIQQMAIDTICSGVNGKEIYERSLEIANKAGLADYYMGYPKGVPFMGHGIGLEINEWPVLARGIDIELKEGMVIAIEPKFTFPNVGIVGIENTFAIRKDGIERLTFGEDSVFLIKAFSGEVLNM